MPLPKTEIELRGFMTPGQQDKLHQRLKREAVRSERDDKRTLFYEYKGGILKVSEETAKNRAKLSLKLGEETTNELTEYDLPFSSEGFGTVVELLDRLGYKVKADVPQKRTDYFLGDVVLSLKHTPDWGHHFEAEYAGGEDLSRDDAAEKLKAFCDSYGLVPLTRAELAGFLDKLSAK